MHEQEYVARFAASHIIDEITVNKQLNKQVIAVCF